MKSTISSCITLRSRSGGITSTQHNTNNPRQSQRMETISAVVLPPHRPLRPHSPSPYSRVQHTHILLGVRAVQIMRFFRSVLLYVFVEQTNYGKWQQSDGRHPAVSECKIDHIHLPNQRRHSYFRTSPPSIPNPTIHNHNFASRVV